MMLNPMPTPIAIKVPESVAPLIPIPIREEVQHAIAIHNAVGVPATLTEEDEEEIRARINEGLGLGIPNPLSMVVLLTL